ALAMLSQHPWPGNVRELRNAVERAAVLGGAKPLDSADFSLNSNGNGRNGIAVLPQNGTYDLRSQVEEVERALILKALDASKGNRREAAHLLGISLRTLFYELRRVHAAEGIELKDSAPVLAVRADIGALLNIYQIVTGCCAMAYDMVRRLLP